MKFYTPDEIADLLKISSKTVRNYIKTGELGATRFGKLYRISEEEFSDFLNKNKAEKEN